VNITDRVVSTPSECACYVMQQLNIAGQRVLAFYDSGANSNIIEYDLARDAGFHQIGFQTVSFYVAGGGSVRSSYGQFSAILGPDVNGNIHDIECQAVDQIIGTLPTFRLDDIITEARATIGSHHVFPLEIGGAPVKLLIGIRSTQLAPVLKFTLPSGLCVYKSKFRDVYGATLCFGSPHEVFTRGYKQAGFRITSGMLQVLFTESATAYMGGIRAVVGASIEEEEAADGLSSVPPAAASQPGPVGPAGDVVAREATDSPSSAQPAVETAQPEPTGGKVTSETTDDPPSVPLAAAIIQPEPAINVIAQGTPHLPTTLGPCDPLAVCVDVAPPLYTGEDSPVNVQRPPVVGDPPEPVTGAKHLDLPPDAPEQNMLLMVAASAPNRPPLPPEPSTGMDDERIFARGRTGAGFHCCDPGGDRQGT
jgi:hypothetical protein